MILNPQQILERYKNPDLRIEQAKEDHRKYLMHVHGIDVVDYLSQVEGLESEQKINLRKKLARSNKALFAEVLRPIDKIFKAKGGSKNYKLAKTNQDNFKDRLHSLKGGISLSKWLENYWIDKYAIDPNGLIMIEHDGKECYPTYKSILTIRDYKQNGQNVDYIIFEPYFEKPENKQDESSEYVRVYDDSGDKTYIIQGDNIELVEDFPNRWKQVPAVIISDLINPITNFKKSSIYEQIELADEYLRENSIKTLFKYHHGFPFFWMYFSACPRCNGSGLYNGELCGMCNGTGYAIKKDVSDITLLKPPTTSDQPVLTDLAGYVVPPIETWQQMTEELKLLKDMIKYSHWGTILEEGDVERTATEVTLNAQPIQDRLNNYSDSLEIIETIITDFIGIYYYGGSYKGSSVNYGRNYIIKGTQQLLDEYAKLKMDNAGLNLLNSKLMEIISAKYTNDEYMMAIYEKLAWVEPFVHNTIEEVRDMNLSSDDYGRKVMYNDWLSEKSNDYFFATTIEVMKKDLINYTKTNFKIKENEKIV